MIFRPALKLAIKDKDDLFPYPRNPHNNHLLIHPNPSLQASQLQQLFDDLVF